MAFQSFGTTNHIAVEVTHFFVPTNEGAPTLHHLKQWEPVPPTLTNLPHECQMRADDHPPMLKNATIRVDSGQGRVSGMEGAVPTAAIVRGAFMPAWLKVLQAKVHDKRGRIAVDSFISEILAYILRRPAGTVFECVSTQRGQGGWEMPWTVVPGSNTVKFRYTVPGLTPPTRYGFVCSHADGLMLVFSQ